MSCDWQEKIALFADDELDALARDQAANHLAGCPECTATVAEHLALKQAVRLGANRYSAPPELHASIYRQLHPSTAVSRWWKWGLSGALALLLAVLGLVLWSQRRTDPLLAQLVDQHVIALAAVNPYDVISEDRHTVKPWFQGKLPFTFNLPEVAGTPYKLLGGKLIYAGSTPGAQVVYQAGQHKISVFMLQDTGRSIASPRSSFTVKNWKEGSVRFYLVTDANEAEAGKLATMLQEANRS
ncbi:MAG TPA: zf-HC2 domain-containing protein [Candidatus Angelobacter sp.]|jgi:anti-sigma factor RsiW|nr:zf-HC2 domain-containing protein [Candidatus Angelobacter sp.]